MVVCKFFLQGTCKFGNMCKFQHEINDSYNPYQTTGSSILRSSNFGATPLSQPNKFGATPLSQPNTFGASPLSQPNNFGATPLSQPKLIPQEKPSVDTGMLVKSVVTDMTQAEKGGQWLFSCYAPFKEKPAFPGFEDQSFEELRNGYYDAAKAGTAEQFKQQVHGMVQEVLMKVRSLQNPSPDIVNILINMYNTPASLQAGVYSGNAQSNSASNFSFKSGGISQQSTSIFAQANQNIFGNSQQQQQQQQQQQSIFSTPANSVFGGNNQNSQNLFVNQHTNNAFGNVSAAPQVSPNSSNIFAQANSNLGVQNNNSIFGNQPSTVTANAGSLFSNHSQQTNVNATTANSGSIFSNNPQPSNANMFVQNPQNNVFQPVSLAPNIFAPNNSVKPNLPPKQSSSIFNQPQNTQFLQPQNNQFPLPQTNQFLPQPQNNQFAQSQNDQLPQSQNNQFLPSQPSIFSQASTFLNPNSVMAPRQNETAPQSYSTSIFNNNAQNTAGTALSIIPENIDQSVYSKFKDLTEEEIKWFQSDDLDISKIPEKPPTYEMCFKI